MNFISKVFFVFQNMLSFRKYLLCQISLKSFQRVSRYKKELSNKFIKSSDIIDDENYEIGNWPSSQQTNIYIKFVISSDYEIFVYESHFVKSFLPVLIACSLFTLDFIFSINLAYVRKRLIIIRLTTSKAFPEIFI